VTTHYHLGLSVRGAIRNGEWRGTLVGACTDGDRVLTADEILTALLDHLQQGHEVIPYGVACDRWDWKDGCRGHPKESP